MLALFYCHLVTYSTHKYLSNLMVSILQYFPGVHAPRSPCLIFTYFYCQLVTCSTHANFRPCFDTLTHTLRMLSTVISSWCPYLAIGALCWSSINDRLCKILSHWKFLSLSSYQAWLLIGYLNWSATFDYPTHACTKGLSKSVLSICKFVSLSVKNL